MNNTTANTTANATANSTSAKSDPQDLVASIIESFIELGVSLYDYPGTQDAQRGMLTNLQRNVQRLQNLNKLANDPQCVQTQTNVPVEVVQYIEDGRNPDIYTREFIEAIRRSNQYQRAKLLALQSLKNNLAEKIVEEFPDLHDSVQLILSSTHSTPSEPSTAEQH